MMNDSQFLEVLKQSFIVYLKTDPRSNEKLKILHGAISKDIKEKLHESRYEVASLGFEAGKEKKINGRYVEKKRRYYYSGRKKADCRSCSKIRYE